MEDGRATEEQRQRVKVQRVAEDHRGHAAFADARLGLEVVAQHGVPGALDVRERAAGETQQRDAGGFGGVDHVLVLLRPLRELAGGHQQDAVGSLHRAGQRAGVAVLADPDLHSLPLQGGGLAGIADEDRDLGGVGAGEQLADNGGAELAGSSRNEDHGEDLLA